MFKWNIVGMNLMVAFIHQMHLEEAKEVYFEFDVCDMPDILNFITI